MSLKKGGSLLLLTLLSMSSQLHAAQPPFDIDLKELDRGTPAVSPKAEKKTTKNAKKPETKKAVPGATSAKGKAHHEAAGSEADYVRYTVKPGDHIFKILIVRFGMSNEAAEKLIPEIVRINNITNIKNLTVGRTLLIPTKGRHEHPEKPTEKATGRAAAVHVEPVPIPAAPAQPLAPVAPAPALPLEAKPTAPVAPAPVAPPPVVQPPVMQPAPEAIPAAPPAAPATPTVSAPATPAVPAPAAAAPALPALSVVAPAPGAEARVTATPQKLPAASVAPQTTTWICSVTGKDPAKIADAVMNALSLHWSRNRIIQSGEGASNAFSIRVDRYFELKGTRYIVSIGENDPYSYTLLRLLEGAGYRVLMVESDDDFQAVGEKLLRLVGLEPDYGRHQIQGGKESTGFLVPQDDAAGRQVLITSEAVNPQLKWTMPEGCGAR